MVSTYTPNIQIEEPARGDYVGTWDTPVNANMTLLDLVVGGRTTISGAAGSVVLAAAQFQCKTITFNSTLLASITVTFPTSFTKSYEIYHTCTGSSAFVITLQTTAAGGQVVCVPPGEIAEVINDGTNIRFKNFGRIGSYWDYAGSSVPNWVTGCTVAPYLNCDATAFSSATYPVLAGMIGTTLPDSKGRVRAVLDQGAGRLSSAGSGVAGNTLFAGGGNQSGQINANNLPELTFVGSAVSFGGTVALVTGVLGFRGSGPEGLINPSAISSITPSGTVNAGSPNNNFVTTQPTYIGGLTLIRAA